MLDSVITSPSCIRTLVVSNMRTGEIWSGANVSLSELHQWKWLIMSYNIFHSHRVHSLYAPSQWEMALQCNAISHWLGTYTQNDPCLLQEQCQAGDKTSKSHFTGPSLFYPLIAKVGIQEQSPPLSGQNCWTGRRANNLGLRGVLMGLHHSIELNCHWSQGRQE